MRVELDARKHQIASRQSVRNISSKHVNLRGLFNMLTANAVIVLSVSPLIFAGIKARMKLGTLILIRRDIIVEETDERADIKCTED